MFQGTCPENLTLAGQCPDRPIGSQLGSLLLKPLSFNTPHGACGIVFFGYTFINFSIFSLIWRPIHSRNYCGQFCIVTKKSILQKRERQQNLERVNKTGVQPQRISVRYADERYQVGLQCGKIINSKPHTSLLHQGYITLPYLQLMSVISQYCLLFRI